MSAKQTGHHGDGASGGERDHYETPKWCVDELFRCLDVVNVSTGVEPCRGVLYQRIYKRMLAEGILTDWFEIQQGRDYLRHDTVRKRCQLGITNPPFRWTMEFLKHMLIQCDTVIMLHRLGLMGGRNRYDFWKSACPTHLLVLSDRPSFTVDGRTDAETYAWYCWDRLGIVTGPPFQWLSAPLSIRKGS